MKLAARRVLVTGAGGFIGAHLVRHLQRLGIEVRAFIHYDSRPGAGNLDRLADRTGLEVVSGDVRDPHQVRRAVQGCDVVFHLAALISVPYSYTAPASFVETNIGGTVHVLEACRDAGVDRVVVTSTSEVYGTATTPRIDESHPLQAQSPYAASKIGADKLAESYHRAFGLPVSILRPFNNYGPWQSNRAVIPQVVAQILSDAPVLRLGALWPRRDFLYVADTCRAFTAMAAAPEAIGQTVHVGTGTAVSIGELAALAMEVLGRSKEIVTDDERLRPDDSEVGLLRCDPGRARRLLGWQAEVDLPTGLVAVAEAMRADGIGAADVGYRV